MALPNKDDSQKDASFMKMEAASGTYQFRVQYSNTKTIPFNECITSPIFTFNGHDCKILCYPQGYGKSVKRNAIGLMLAMHCKSENVTASFTFGLLDVDGRSSSKACKMVQLATFKQDCWDNVGIPNFMEHSELHTHFVRDDCFTLVCSVTILDKFYKEVPKRFVNGLMPFSLDDSFIRLLDRKETADVRFEVDGIIFPAHRLVLSARSWVFESCLSRTTGNTETNIIPIKDMKPAVFKDMLHFIYTDSLPDLSDEDVPLVTMIQLLLLAADRYALAGLKMLCENRLQRDISMNTVVSTLELADQLSLIDLKDRCLLFICDLTRLWRFAFRKDYVQLMGRNPSLLKEIHDRVKDKFV